MATLTITRGLPGSGKSTWARAQPGWRVNRDDLRAMVYAGPWPHGDRDAEEALTQAQHAAIAGLLKAGIDVTCDDTNLRDEVVADLSRLASRAGALLFVHDLRHVHAEVRVLRDARRPEAERVGAARIRQMARDAGLL